MSAMTPWMMGKNGRLQTVPNEVGGCEVIIDESIRGNPHRDQLIAVPDLIGALQGILTLNGARLDGDLREAGIVALKKAGMQS